MNVKRIVNNLIECIKYKFLKINQLIKKLCDKCSPFIDERKEVSLKCWEKIYVKLPAWMKTRITIVIICVIIISVGSISCSPSGGGNNSRIEQIYVQQFSSNLNSMEQTLAEDKANNDYASELRARVRYGEITVKDYKHWQRTSGYRWKSTTSMEEQIDAAKRVAVRGNVGIMSNLIHNTMGGRSSVDIMGYINYLEFFDNNSELDGSTKYTVGDLRCAYAYLIEKGYVNENGEWTKSGKHFIEITKIQKSVPKRFGNLNVDIATFVKLALDYLKEKETLNKKNDVPPTVLPFIGSSKNKAIPISQKPTLDSKYLSKDTVNEINNIFE